MCGNVGNYPSTLRGSTKLQILEYSFEVLHKNVELASSSTFFFCGVEFVELGVFSNVKLERSWKNGSGAVPPPLGFGCWLLLLSSR
jgi:hypothetical protein